jgi:hypothetical protein
VAHKFRGPVIREAADANQQKSLALRGSERPEGRLEVAELEHLFLTTTRYGLFVRRHGGEGR